MIPEPDACEGTARRAGRLDRARDAATALEADARHGDARAAASGAIAFYADMLRSGTPRIAQLGLNWLLAERNGV